MNIHRTTWITFFLLAAVSLAAWFNLTFNQLSFINLSVNAEQARAIAYEHLVNNGEDMSGYQSATIFLSDSRADRYLQKTVGFDGLNTFIEEENFDMFFWLVRFFKEKQKEEFALTISSKTGEVVALKHTVEDTAPASDLEKEKAKELALTFLKQTFSFQPDLYSIKGDLQTIRDFRSDFSFSWQKNDVRIPWNDDPDGGTGKLVTGITLNGDEVLSFSKNTFLVPDDFNRHLKLQRETGENLLTLVRVLFYVLFTAALYTVISRGNHLAMHLTKRTYIIIAGITFVLFLINEFNLIEVTLYNYRTTADLQAYLWRNLINISVSALFISISIFVPGIAGELLSYQNKITPREGSFLHHIQSSFFSRNTAGLIIMGYLCFCILLAIQGIMFYIGQQYMGVWKEQTWITQLSSSKYPFISAFKIAFRASFQEEIMFRLFGLQWFYLILGKVTNSTRMRFIAAALFSSMIWGFAHSHYPIYPMWFRGVEVTMLGLFLSFVYVRFGIITAVSAHFVFDAFWTTAGYLFGQSQPQFMLASVAVLSVPLIWALVAFILNRPNEPKEMSWKLDTHQSFNAGILKFYLQQHPEAEKKRDPDAIRDEIIGHGWDSAVVDSVVRELYGDGGEKE